LSLPSKLVVVPGFATSVKISVSENKPLPGLPAFTELPLNGMPPLNVTLASACAVPNAALLASM